jgi:predicted TIM-barrel fold metal-dependent hydrolase
VNVDRFVVISADCHAVGLPEHFRAYFTAEHLDAYEESLRVRSEGPDTRAKASEDGGLLFSREALDEYESHDATEAVAGGTAGQWDSARRIAELEDDGVVAEVVFPNGGPFVAGRGGEPYPRELRTAGLLAYNRWLADFCAQAPERRAGIAQLPIHDVDLAVAEVQRAAANGLRGVTVRLVVVVVV